MGLEEEVGLLISFSFKEFLEGVSSILFIEVYIGISKLSLFLVGLFILF